MTAGSSNLISATINASALTGSFANLVVPTTSIGLLVLVSDSDAKYLLSFGDDANPLTVPGAVAITIDLSADKMAGLGIVKVKHNGVVPTSGTISALIIQKN